MIVVDASALVGALVGSSATAVERLAGEPLLHAPQLLPLEVASALRGLTLDRRLSDAVARVALRKLSALPIALHPHNGLVARIWELRAALTVYDSAYVALAEALDLALVTADARLARVRGLRCAIEVV